MRKMIAAYFLTRRDAEMVVEHLLQEHSLPPGAVKIIPASEQNSAGTTGNGSDAKAHISTAAIQSALMVTAHIDDTIEDIIKGSFATFGGTEVNK